MTKKSIWFLFIYFTSFACQERPTFPLTPSISLNDLYFQEIEGLSLDSLVIKLKFEDGDGDLGLEAHEILPPYHLYEAEKTPDGDTLRYGDPGTPPYDCVNYEIIRQETSVNGSLVVNADTIYVDRNADHFNFYLTFLTEQANGEFEEYIPALERNCAPPYHGRYFLLNSAGDVRPLTGELQYTIVSGFRLLFRNETIKIRIQIGDRDLNKSNIIETDEFNINDVIRPVVI